MSVTSTCKIRERVGRGSQWRYAALSPCVHWGRVRSAQKSAAHLPEAKARHHGRVCVATASQRARRLRCARIHWDLVTCRSCVELRTGYGTSCAHVRTP